MGFPEMPVRADNSHDTARMWKRAMVSLERFKEFVEILNAKLIGGKRWMVAQNDHRSIRAKPGEVRFEPFKLSARQSPGGACGATENFKGVQNRKMVYAGIKGVVCGSRPRFAEKLLPESLPAFGKIWSKVVVSHNKAFWDPKVPGDLQEPI